MSRRSVFFWMILGLVLAASRLAHVNILWADEDYHMAAAIQMLRGKMLYSEVWYDKPPGAALLALLFGAYPGWPLRIAGTLAAVAGSVIAYRFASSLWSPREGYIAAALLGFSQIFYFAQGAMPLEPDTWMILPHLLAVYWAWKGRSFAAGLAAGCACLLTPKGAFVLFSAFVFQPAGLLPMALGFAIPNTALLLWLASAGALGDYWEQVWQWGFAYSKSSPDQSALAPLWRLGGWAGFHGALIVGALQMKEGPRKRIALWIAISFAAAAIGWRLPPRYLNQPMVPLVIAAAYGWRSRKWLAVGAVLLAVPLVRFGPRYFNLDNWGDTALDRESRAAASIIHRLAQPGDSIFIWGYRPNIVAYTRLPITSRLWESQPLTGVPADRHLRESQPIETETAAARRRELAQTSPSFIADGLSLYNPALDIRSYPELKEWFARYCEAGSAGGLRVYRRCR